MEVISFLSLILYRLSSPILCKTRLPDSTFQPAMYSNNQGQETRMGGAYSPEFMMKPELLQREGFGSWSPAHSKWVDWRHTCVLWPARALTQGPGFCFPGSGKVTIPTLERMHQIWPGQVNNYLSTCKMSYVTLGSNPNLLPPNHRVHIPWGCGIFWSRITHSTYNIYEYQQSPNAI